MPFVKKVVGFVGFAIAQQVVHFDVEWIGPAHVIDEPPDGTVEGGVGLGEGTDRDANLTGFFISIEVDMAGLGIELPL